MWVVEPRLVGPSKLEWFLGFEFLFKGFLMTPLCAGCNWVSCLIKDKSVEDIRKTFNILNDIAPKTGPAVDEGAGHMQGKLRVDSIRYHQLF